MITPSVEELKRALAIAEEIQRLKGKIDSIMSAKPPPPARTNRASKPAARQEMSADARARIAAAQRARWAKIKGKSKGTAATTKPAKKKGGITPAGRAKLAASMKARWAARKASGEPAPIVSTPPNAVL